MENVIILRQDSAIEALMVRSGTASTPERLAALKRARVEIAHAAGQPAYGHICAIDWWLIPAGSNTEWAGR